MRDFHFTEEQAWATPINRAWAYAAFHALHHPVSPMELDCSGYIGQEIEANME